MRAGDVVAVTESMKMEFSLTAPAHGRVREVLVSANTQVAAGRPLLAIEPLEDERSAGGRERLRFEPGEREADGDPGPRKRLVWLVLGYDVPTEETRRILEDACYRLFLSGPWLHQHRGLPTTTPA